MKTLVLRRQGMFPDQGMFGRQEIWSESNGILLNTHTVELPWRNNEPYVSCIPAGTYLLKKTMFYKPQRFGRKAYPCYQVLDVPGRTYIKFHRANTIRDLLGCIGQGDSWGRMAGLWAVQNSRATHELFMEAMAGDEEALLVVINP